MVIVESYFIAVIMCFITMLCWGSWANTQKLASKSWPFQLFYWDYSIGVLILAFIFAFTIGSFGENGRSFLDDIYQADTASINSAFIGGVVFNLSNILLVVAIDIAGMAVAIPVGVGLALIIGVLTNYLASPVGNPIYIFAGVLLVVIAIIVDAMAYNKLPSSSGNKSSNKGLIISAAAGILMGFFYRFVAASMSTDYIMLDVGKLSPYTAIVVFSIGLFLSNFIFNTFVMYKPLSGKAVTYRDYFSEGNPKLHLIGVLGGIIWNIGMSFSVIASGAAGFAISYGLGQGATMIAAAWGVFIWKEFKDAPPETDNLIKIMFLSFIVGLSLIIAARLL